MTEREQDVLLTIGQLSIDSTGALFSLVSRALLADRIKTDEQRLKGYLMRLSASGFVKCETNSVRITEKASYLFKWSACLEWRTDEPDTDKPIFIEANGVKHVGVYTGGHFGVINGTEIMWLPKETKVRWIKEIV